MFAAYGDDHAGVTIPTDNFFSLYVRSKGLEEICIVQRSGEIDARLRGVTIEIGDSEIRNLRQMPRIMHHGASPVAQQISISVARAPLGDSLRIGESQELTRHTIVDGFALGDPELSAQGPTLFPNPSQCLPIDVDAQFLRTAHDNCHACTQVHVALNRVAMKDVTLHEQCRDNTRSGAGANVPRAEKHVSQPRVYAQRRHLPSMHCDAVIRVKCTELLQERLRPGECNGWRLVQPSKRLSLNDAGSREIQSQRGEV